MPTAYLLAGCPFSFKLLLFLSEAQLLDRVKIETVEADSGRMEELKKKFESATGKKGSFPTVEIEPGVYKSDSDALITHFSDAHGINPSNLVALSFYKQSILPQLEKLH
jgi:hypothetical protein